MRDNPETAKISQAPGVRTAYVDTKCQYCNMPIVILKGRKYNRYGNKYTKSDKHRCRERGAT